MEVTPMSNNKWNFEELESENEAEDIYCDPTNF